MIYTPKKTNSRPVEIYTGGGLLFTINGNSYTGMYIIIQSIPYSVDENGNAIERLFDNNDNRYLTYKKLNSSNDEYIIVPFIPKPNKKDYENGTIQRYLLKRKLTTDIDIIEVSRESYNRLKGLNNAITQLYDFIELTWVITGNKEDLRQNNYETVQLLEQTYTGISLYLSNLIQFWKLK